MDTILRIGFYILVLNVGLILIISLWYLTIGRHQKEANEFEDYIAYLFNHDKVRDPWILSGDKWVKNE
jgi:hypothetical protein